MVAGKIVGEGVEKLAKESAEKVAKEITEKLARESAEKLAREAAEAAGKKAAKETAEATGKQLAEKTAEKFTKKSTEKIAKEGVDYASRWTNMTLGARGYAGMKHLSSALKNSSSRFVRAAGHGVNFSAELVRHAKWTVPASLVAVFGMHKLTAGESTKLLTNVAINTLEATADGFEHISPAIAAALRKAGPEVAREAVEIITLPSQALATAITVGAERSGHPIDEKYATTVAQAIEGDWLFAALPILTQKDLSEEDLANIAVEAYRSGDPTQYFADKLGIDKNKAIELRETLKKEYQNESDKLLALQNQAMGSNLSTKGLFNLASSHSGMFGIGPVKGFLLTLAGWAATGISKLFGEKAGECVQNIALSILGVNKKWDELKTSEKAGEIIAALGDKSPFKALISDTPATPHQDPTNTPSGQLPAPS